MTEDGVGVHALRPKHVDEFRGSVLFDLVITLCLDASPSEAEIEAACPRVSDLLAPGMSE